MEYKSATDIKTPERNRYFYGKLLDVYHFDLETTYFNSKRWLLNRLVFGFGVVCGLDVQLNQNRKSVTVSPGAAIDGWGHEIIVPKESTLELPECTARATESEIDSPQCPEEIFYHIRLCYYECETDPAPVLAGGDCGSTEICAPGIIQERFKLVLREGKAPDINTESSIPELLLGDRLNYQALARWVTDSCPQLPDDPCIPLANIRLPDPAYGYDDKDIDITIRPIVYTNDLLFEMILALAGRERSHHPRGGKS